MTYSAYMAHAANTFTGLVLAGGNTLGDMEEGTITLEYISHFLHFHENLVGAVWVQIRDMVRVPEAVLLRPRGVVFHLLIGHFEVQVVLGHIIQGPEALLVSGEEDLSDCGAVGTKPKFYWIDSRRYEYGRYRCTICKVERWEVLKDRNPHN